jgi:hypothetical protein
MVGGPCRGKGWYEERRFGYSDSETASLRGPATTDSEPFRSAVSIEQRFYQPCSESKELINNANEYDSSNRRFAF